MIERFLIAWFGFFAIWLIAAMGVQAQEPIVVEGERPCELLLDCRPRTALLSAFGLEADVYLRAVEQRQVYVVNGIRFTTGRLRGQDVVIALTNVSLPNAVLVAQVAFDHFRIERVIMSGIAGGVDPALALGDVAIPERWALYQELWFENPHAEPPPVYRVPDTFGLGLAPIHRATGEPAEASFGFMFARQTTVTSASDPQYQDPEALGFPASGSRFWFEVDAELLELARSLPDEVELLDCAIPDGGPEEVCASDESGRPPELVVDGNGVAGPTFVNHAEYREYVFDTFTFDDGGSSPDRVKVLDMETAGVAFVAAANEVPYIAVRTVSDLAGSEPSENLLPVFANLAIANTSATVLRLLEKL